MGPMCACPVVQVSTFQHCLKLPKHVQAQIALEPEKRFVLKAKIRDNKMHIDLTLLIGLQTKIV